MTLHRPTPLRVHMPMRIHYYMQYTSTRGFGTPEAASGAASLQCVTNAGQTAYTENDVFALPYSFPFLPFVALFLLPEVKTPQSPTLYSVGIGLDKQLNKSKGR
jgi:hypothetical protein